MSATTFDTHAALRALTRAGVATKADLDTDLAALDAKIAALKADLYRALWIQGAGLVAVMVALRLFG